MKETPKMRILRQIKKKGKGYVFSANNFLLDFKRFEVDQSLSSLLKEGVIERVITGIYYYPEYNNLLKRNIAPDIHQIAKVLAYKNNWKIVPEGNTALNYLGLSTQIPAKYIYISNGPSHKYKIGETNITFQHKKQQESGISDNKTSLVVQAIKSMGKFYASQSDFIQNLSSKFSKDDWDKIEKKAQKVPYWILEIIIKAKGLKNETNY